MVTPKSRHRTSVELQIYNSLSRTKEPFTPIEPGKVRMYTCGLTVNYLMHIGHARTYIVWDVVERFFEHQGFEVQHVSNITDISVDDNILKQVRASGEAFQQLTTRHTKDYYHDRQLLGIREPFTYVIATQHIQEMIDLVQRLLDGGFAYEAADGVYFRISTFPKYGQLAGLDPKTLQEGASGRMNKDEYDKEHVGDFVLWKRAKPGEPFWHSPWGPGRPGWHIECSAMSMKYLGETIDISGGGEDNLFPHHENSIAQSEAVTGKPYVRYWMHVRHLQLGSEKMSKSTGNFLTVRDAVQEYDPATLRLFLLSTHYRKPIIFSPDELQRTHQRIDRLRQILGRITAIATSSIDASKDVMEDTPDLGEARTRFEQALLDDFSTGRAINHFFQFINQIQSRLESQSVPNQKTALAWLELFEEMGTILFGDLYTRLIVPHVDSQVASLIELLLAERTRLRNEKQYQQADAIRTALNLVGFEIADTQEGTRWWTKSMTRKTK